MTDNSLPLLSTRNSNNHHRSSPTFRSSTLTEKLHLYALDSVIPKWLSERKDFKDRLKQFSAMDIAHICAKPWEDRTAFEKDSLSKWIRECPFFSSMSNRKLSEVSNLLKTRYFEQGSILIKEGEIGDCLYILVKGLAGIYIEGVDQPVAVKHPRNVVGEAALENTQVRTATVKAETDLIVLMLSCYDYIQSAQRDRQREKHDIKVFLKNTNFFKNLYPSKLELLGNTILVMEYSKNQTVYSLDDQALHFYIIKQGMVSIEAPVCFDQIKKVPAALREWKCIEKKKEMNQVLKSYGPSEFFGERELILGIQRDTQAVVTSDRTILYILSKQGFELIFSSSDKSKLLQNSVCRPTSKELREGIHRKVDAYKKKLNSILNACNVNIQPNGRNSLISRRITRKLSWARSVVQRYKEDLSKELNTASPI